jgi:hypothetical protein
MTPGPGTDGAERTPAAIDPAGMVPALGGDRLVPAPDPVAREYLMLALRLDQHLPGLVDGYYGPADIKAAVDMEQLRPPARLAQDAATLRARLAGDVADLGRRAWLTAQLVALETQAAALAGRPLPYLEHVARCFDWTPRAVPEGELAAARAALDGLLPGPGSLTGRLAAWDAGLTIAVERLGSTVAWLVDRFRERAAADFGLPQGEQLRVSMVTGRPWSGYSWYDGGLRSRVELNTDLPVRAPDLVRVVAHESYPGHHLEHAWKEAGLVLAERRLEHSILLINTPECLLSEGLATLAERFAVPAADEAGLLAELLVRGGVPAAPDDRAAREIALQAAALRPTRARLGAAGGNAAILRHVDGRPRAEVVDYLVTVGAQARERAEQRLDFIEHPLWRTYVLVYSEGEALLGRWLDQPAGPEPRERFARLLREPLTPSSIASGLAPR